MFSLPLLNLLRVRHLLSCTRFYIVVVNLPATAGMWKNKGAVGNVLLSFIRFFMAWRGLSLLSIWVDFHCSYSQSGLRKRHVLCV